MHRTAAVQCDWDVGIHDFAEDVKQNIEKKLVPKSIMRENNSELSGLREQSVSTLIHNEKSEEWTEISS